ncbi:hypothetical protein [Maritalea porphyrae]|uniref:hypothetical protein n=1 Tax=Maritalea porphyrae TaxID=880732 RepID=UPI0022AF7B9B|nr:hypothetical protein [Maritalea porphyrae]MCZ4271142.1 hypothetical protein [Maritalea porphyrae]
MRRSPLEQLNALSASRSSDRLSTSNDHATKVDDDAVAAVHKDMAIERISSELGPIILDGQPEMFGAGIRRSALDHFWEWAQRDLDQTEISKINDVLGGQSQPDEREIERSLSKIVDIVSPIFAQNVADSEQKRRLTIQVGGVEVFDAIPTILLAFSYISYIGTGANLGRELSENEEPEAFIYALEHIDFPSNDIKSLWCQTFATGVLRPDLLAAAIAKLSYASTEEAIKKSGYGEYVDALITNAQQQIEMIEKQTGIFRDIDLTCKAIDRFHHIARGLQFHLDLSKSSKWNISLERLVKRGANALSGKFVDVLRDVKKVLGPAPRGATSIMLDPADVLQAYNGLYIMAATRSARESLAVNAVVERGWKDVGTALEAMVDRIFEHFKHSTGSDAYDNAQMDIVIKFCSIRFGVEYAAILRRNRDNILRRAGGMRASS